MKRTTSYIFILLIIIQVNYSCRSSRPLASPPPVSASATATASSYIKQYSELAISEMKRTGIPASITLAQGMVESDYGRSTLAREANNHFGIKCHNSWNGPSIRYHDDRRNECFRKYRNAGESYRDHSDFLVSGSRYSFLFSLDPYDYKAWARGLKKAGYATNPDYANMLIRKIEENALYNYDRGYTASSTARRNGSVSTTPSATVPAKTAKSNTSPASATKTTAAVTTDQVPPGQGDTATARSVANSGTQPAAAPVAAAPVSSFGDLLERGSRVMVNNGVRYILVKKEDTFESIAMEFGVLKGDLARFNDLPGNFELKPGQTLYLQMKRDSVAEGIMYHTVAEGETMYLIAQKYAITLLSLYEVTGIRQGTALTAGQRLRMSLQAPVN
ncbi:MAG: glucosaminidase domain-containing protein [Bacteroidales bacterium]|jgi:LysM repeat protein|nr:glucosaminidase domain-containing protein [Bacteroidales bacterium]